MCSFQAVVSAKKGCKQQGFNLLPSKAPFFDTSHSTSEGFYIQRWKAAAVSVQKATMHRELNRTTFRLNLKCVFAQKVCLLLYMCVYVASYRLFRLWMDNWWVIQLVHQQALRGADTCQVKMSSANQCVALTGSGMVIFPSKAAAIQLCGFSVMTGSEGCPIMHYVGALWWFLTHQTQTQQV